ncbi:MAG: hypothetical protein PHV13_05315 [Candidatus ainarchaeum sp.]|nr:hypothetical protein [Candidatus ainarchaeum sp.]
MQRQKSLPTKAGPGAATCQMLLFRPPAEPKLDFIDAALAAAEANRKKGAMPGKRITWHMGQVLESTTIVATRAHLLAERMRN